jgi:hypothetical protein
MITVKLMGGMGNQMFQYAAAMAVACRRKTSVALDLSFLLDRTPRPDFVFRDFDLDIFNLPQDIQKLETLPKEIQKKAPLISHPRFISLISRGFKNSYPLRFFISRFLLNLPFFAYNEPFFEFNPLIFDLPASSYLSGYFQSPKYFSEIESQIREQFKLQPDLSEEAGVLADDIKNSHSVCINVRRADFVHLQAASETHGFCDLKYFERCISLVTEKEPQANFFVFSDDVEWCKDNFSGKTGFTIVDHSHKGPKFSWYLHLMTLCKHFIIPNSSFAWWAAWLSQRGGLVLAPKNWFRDAKINTADLFPDHWHLISN